VTININKIYQINTKTLESTAEIYSHNNMSDYDLLLEELV